MTRSRALLMGAALSLCLSCSSMTVKSDYDDTTSLAKFHTYAWGHSDTQKPLSDGMIRKAIASELKNRGYREVKAGKKADLIVSYRSTFSQKVATNDLDFAFGQQPGIAEGYGGEEPAAFPYEEAEFDIDLLDRKSGRVIWQSSGTRVLQYDDVSQDQVGDAIERIFASFPMEKS